MKPHICLPLLHVALAATAATIFAAEPPFRFAEATIDQLQAQMSAGTLTARELTAAYLDRIAQLDKAGPKLNAIIELNPDALAIADQLDAERRTGKVRGPLHGIPILLKDNIATADRMETTAGSLALVGAKPPRDAFIVTRLREAGAVILGKTNPSEWANFRSTTAVSGWSGRGGQTRNPFALDRTPNGSSSGSAVAVSANLCVVAVGTETDGSIVSPASNCGVVGIKPTVGLLSRSGIIPISVSQDTPGPLARTVHDAALLLGVLAGADAHDAATANRPLESSADFAHGMQPHALRGARLGLLRGPFGFPARLQPVLADVVSKLKAAGAEVVDLGELPSLEELGAPETTVLLYEFKDGINAWFASLGSSSPVKSLADLIAFDEAHRDREMPFFGQELLLAANKKGPPTDPAYREARAICLRLTRTEGIDALLAKHRLTALVALTDGPAAALDPIYGDRLSGSSSLAAVAGYPDVTVPAADVLGLPVGVSFFGRAWDEPRLLAIAADFESHTSARRVPEFLPTVAVPPAAPPDR